VSTVSITKKTVSSRRRDWRDFDAMTAVERHAAAVSDPDA
jgi:hypothetical protein